MHAKTACRLRNIMIAKLIYPLDMLPADAIRRHGIFRWIGSFARPREQRLFYIIGVSGFRKVVDGAGFYRGNRRCDVAVTGQHDNATVFPFVADLINDLEAVTIFEAQVDDCECGSDFLDDFAGVIDACSEDGLKPAFFHGAPKSRAKGLVIINN